LPFWVPCGLRAETLLRVGLLLAASMAFEKFRLSRPLLLESESELGLNWLASLLG
jgi:hypothetical protein